MDTITQSGAAFRTHVMPKEQAFSFAQALQANAQYRDVAVWQHHAGQWFVTYRPTDEKREQAIIARAAEKREQRAQEEEFEFIERDEGLFWCVSPSGNVYLTTLETCGCPDWEYRGQHVGVPCKHIVAARNLSAASVADERKPIYDEDYTGPRWTYGLTYRPAAQGLGSLTSESIIGADRPHPKFRHGTVQFPRELTEAEVSRLELTLVSDPAADERRQRAEKARQEIREIFS